MLNFDEQTHTYTLDGKKIPSVSEIMKSITIHFYTEDIPEFVLQKACERGHNVHKAIEEYELFDDYSIPEIHKGYFEQYLEWKKKYNPIILHQEYMLTDGEYGGTIDLICEIDNEIWLIDFKTSRELHENLVRVQLQGYDNLCSKNGLKIDKLGTLHLQPKKYEFREITGNEEMWNICLTCYKYGSVNA